MHRGMTTAAAVMLVFAVKASWAAAPCGDVNGSGKLSSADALLVLRLAVGQDVQPLCGPYGQILRSGQKDDLGTGSDGDVQAGVPRNYVEHGDGTVTDTRTGLMWEKKDDSGGIHDADNTYTWTTGGTELDGSAVSNFLVELNGNGGFAGHTDWRIPNTRELLTILHFGIDTEAAPMVFPVFDGNCAPGCSSDGCSCTRSSPFWSSTAARPDGPTRTAWVVRFDSGKSERNWIGTANRVRAVRGGL